METVPAPRILMCPPDHFAIEYEINPWMNVRVGSDAGLAFQQWTALRKALESLGVSVDLIEPVRGLPDLVFTANAGLVFRNLFIVSRFRYGVRQGEAPCFESWAQSRGFQVVELPPGYNFEGAGDALFCGRESWEARVSRRCGRGPRSPRPRPANRPLMSNWLLVPYGLFSRTSVRLLAMSSRKVGVRGRKVE